MNLACPHLIRLTDAGPVLLGSCCAECGERYFPRVGACSRCCSTQIEVTELGGRGTLWSWTIQSFQPKPPYDGGRDAAAFEPYGVGYVEMPCGTKVESRLMSTDETQFNIGMPMRLVLEPYRTRADGSSRCTYAFAPAPNP